MIYVSLAGLLNVFMPAAETSSWSQVAGARVWGGACLEVRCGWDCRGWYMYIYIYIYISLYAYICII